MLDREGRFEDGRLRLYRAEKREIKAEGWLEWKTIAGELTSAKAKAHFLLVCSARRTS